MMNENAMLHLHSLELRETFKTLQQFLTNEEAGNVLVRHLTGGKRYDATIISFLKSYTPARQYEDDKIAYYLLAGVGIRRIISLLKVSQPRVYQVKENWNGLEERPLEPFHSLFKQEPVTIEKLQTLMKRLNVLDGFRILEEPHPHSFLHGQTRRKQK